MKLKQFEDRYRRLLDEIDLRADGIAEAIKPGGESLTEGLRQIRATLKVQGDAVLEEGKLLQIGVMGQIKSGKSTFVNALLFNGKQVLPRGATPKTANLTVITYGEENMLRVTFYTRQEWEALISASENGNPEVSLAARELLQQARTVGGGEDCIGSGTREIRFPDSESLERQLGQYVGEAGVLAPFVKSTELFLHNDLLKGLSIVDTPGLNDRIYSRVRQTQKCMEKCDVVFYLSAASDFMDTVDARLLFEQLPEKGVAKLVLIASKYDSALMDAVWMKGSLEAADRDSRLRLNRQADYVVNYFLESTGSVRMAENVRACLPPLFVSSLADAMVGRDYFSYNDEERRISDGLCPEGGLTDDMLRKISSFDAVRQLYNEIARKKQETLLTRGDTILRASRSLLEKEVVRLDTLLAGKSRLIEVPDELALQAAKLNYERCRSQLASGFEEIFSGLRERLQNAVEDASVRLTEAGDGVAKLQERRSVRNITKTEKIKISKWYLPWTWGRYKEVSTTVSEFYPYYAVEECTDRLRQFARDSAALLSERMALSADIEGVRRELLSHALTALGNSEVSFDPSFLRALAEDAVRRLTLNAPTVSVGGQIDEITARFGKEAAGQTDMDALHTQAASVVEKIRSGLLDSMRSETGAVIERFPGLSRELETKMTAAIRAELEEAEDRSLNREKYVAEIAEARKYLLRDGELAENG